MFLGAPSGLFAYSPLLGPFGLHAVLRLTPSPTESDWDGASAVLGRLIPRLSAQPIDSGDVNAAWSRFQSLPTDRRSAPFRQAFEKMADALRGIPDKAYEQAVSETAAELGITAFLDRSETLATFVEAFHRATFETPRALPASSPDFSPIFSIGELLQDFHLSALTGTAGAAVYDVRSVDAEMGHDATPWRPTKDHIPEPLRGLREGEEIFEFLKKPLTDRRRILQRQALVETFRGQEALDRLIDLKNQAYDVGDGVDRLFMLVSIDDHHQTPLINAYRDGHHQYKYDVERFLGAIAEGRHAAEEAAGLLKRSGSPFLQKVAEELEAALSSIEPLTRESLLGHPEEDSRNQLLARDFQRTMAQYGLFAQFATIAKRDGYARASFDPSKPYAFQGGWLFAREKSKQIANDSPKPTATTVYTGSNMSGKSFELKKQFYTQLLAQTFGYAPCREGNFGIYDSFHYLDRAATDHAVNLSAFGREIADWCQAFALFKTRPFLCCDEGFSTTSPEDQFRLLTAVERYLRGREARVFYANHNEFFCDRLVGDPQVGLYHLETASAEGRVTYHRRLKEGVGDSMALEVANDLGLPREIIDTARRYLEGRSVKEPSPAQGKGAKVVSYTEEERAERKARAMAPSAFIPTRGDENALFRLFSEDRSFQPDLFYGSHLHLGEARRIGEEARGLLGDRSSARSAFLFGMLAQGPGTDPRDVVERQRTFDAMAATAPSPFERAVALEEKVLTLVRFFDFFPEASGDLFSFNVDIAPFRAFHHDAEPENLDLLLTWLELNRKIMGEAFPLEEDYQGLKALISLLGTVERLTREMDIDRIIEIQEAEERETIADEGLLDALRRLFERFGQGPGDSRDRPVTRNAVRAYLRWLDRTKWSEAYRDKDANLLRESIFDLHSDEGDSLKTHFKRIITTVRAAARAIGEEDPGPGPRKITLGRIERLRERLGRRLASGDEELRVHELPLEDASRWVGRAAGRIGIQPEGQPRLIGDLLHQAIHRRIEKTIRKGKSLPPKNFFDCRLEEIRGELATLVRHRISKINMRDYDGLHEMPPEIRFALGLSFLLDEGDAVSEFVSMLRAIDSIPCHQMANFLEKSLRKYVTAKEKPTFRGGRDPDENDLPSVKILWTKHRAEWAGLAGEEAAGKIDADLDRDDRTSYDAFHAQVGLFSGKPLKDLATTIYQNTVKGLADDLKSLRDLKNRLRAEHPRLVDDDNGDEYRDAVHLLSELHREWQRDPSGAARKCQRDDSYRYLFRYLAWYKTGTYNSEHELYAAYFERMRRDTGKGREAVFEDFLRKELDGSPEIQEIHRICAVLARLGDAAEAVRIKYGIEFEYRDHDSGRLVRNDKAYQSTHRGDLHHLENALKQRYRRAMAGIFRTDNFAVYDGPAERTNQRNILCGELFRASAFFLAGHLIREQGHARVIYSETGEVALQDAWSLVVPQEGQVPGDFRFGPGEMVKLINGTNMSGKTFLLKKAALAVLWAMATGYAPAASATLPVFDGVIFLDRVRAKSDKNLSAFGNEVGFWKSFLETLAGGKRILVLSLLDEIFSTTSSRYQAALSYAVALQSMRLGHPMALASHNHEMIGRLAADFPEEAAPYHFAWETKRGEKGEEFVPLFKIQPGHISSNALLIARTLGFPPEILEIAETLLTNKR